MDSFQHSSATWSCEIITLRDASEMFLARAAEAAAVFSRLMNEKTIVAVTNRATFLHFFCNWCDWKEILILSFISVMEHDILLALTTWLDRMFNLFERNKITSGHLSCTHTHTLCGRSGLSKLFNTLGKKKVSIIEHRAPVWFMLYSFLFLL